MTYEFRLPDIGEGVAQGEVVRWFVKEGDSIREEDPLVSVLTDKANVEIPSPVSGRVLRIHAKEGEVVKVGGLLVTLEPSATGGAPAATPAPHPETAPAKAPSSPTPPAASTSPAPESSRVLATPSVRRKAQQMGIDLAAVKGSGPNGRITESDLESFSRGPATGPSPPGGPPTAPPAPSAQPLGLPSTAGEARAVIPAAPRGGPPGGSPLQERLPIRGVRRVISEHMALATHRAAHYTYVEEVDVTDLVKVRERSRKRLEEKGTPLTYLPFIIKAVIHGLRAHPTLNAYMDDEKQELVVCHYYNIGVAAAAPEGLIVPVVREADKKSISGIAREIQDLSERGKAGKLSREELTGSTFTITSLGALGGVLATPILNYPEVGILGVHKIQRRPVYGPEGELVPAHLMNLSISLDHRVIDGAVGAQFLAVVKSYLEDPHQIFLDMA